MQKLRFVYIMLFITALIGACNKFESHEGSNIIPTKPSLSKPYIFPVDLLFADFYHEMGGERRLGPAISPLFESGDKKIQYLEAGLLTYDPTPFASEPFSLAPLAIMWDIAEPAVPVPKNSDVRYLNGHIIFSEFVSLYDELGGTRIVGQPLTEGRHNPEQRRIEQYFENLGFYRFEQDPPGIVRLMSYGVFACDQNCRYRVQPAAIPSLYGYLPEPFAAEVAKLGLSFTGYILSGPSVAPDGKTELVFENIVLIDDHGRVNEIVSPFQLWLPGIFREPGEQDVRGGKLTIKSWLPFVIDRSPRKEEKVDKNIRSSIMLPLIFGDGVFSEQELKLRPIVEMLGIIAQRPVFNRNDPLMVFYLVDGKLGYHVPVLFDTFLNRFGGTDVSGNPISETFSLGNNVFRQCFVNLCLDYDINKSASENLTVAPLGLEYKDRYVQLEDSIIVVNKIDNIEIEIVETQAYVAPDESQEIEVLVSDGGLPLMNRELVLKITLPDGSQQEYMMGITNKTGSVKASIPAILAPNGTLIPYEVCATNLNGEEKCRQDHYLIWEDIK